MAPAAAHKPRGRRRMLLPSMPPSAATGTPAERARRDQRLAPSPTEPGWLAVANAGERNTSAAPARRARLSSVGPCAELVTIAGLPCSQRRWPDPGQNPARKCTPACSAAASRASPATTRSSRRARHTRAMSRPSAARFGSPSWRSTTPARPRGRRATAGRGSASRPRSVNSHSRGRRARGPPQRAVARAQAVRRGSIRTQTSVRSRSRRPRPCATPCSTRWKDALADSRS